MDLFFLPGCTLTGVGTPSPGLTVDGSEDEVEPDVGDGIVVVPS